MYKINNDSFFSKMPIGVQHTYKVVMSYISGRKLSLAIVNTKGVYNFNILNKAGITLLRIVFLKGGIIEMNPQGVLLYPLRLHSKKEIKASASTLKGLFDGFIHFKQDAMNPH